MWTTWLTCSTTWPEAHGGVRRQKVRWLLKPQVRLAAVVGREWLQLTLLRGPPPRPDRAEPALLLAGSRHGRN